MDGIPCLNCQKTVSAAEAKICLTCYVCPQCFTIAEQIRKRLRDELNKMLLLTDEAIRVAIVKRELVLGPADSAHEQSKKEVLEAIIKLQNAHGDAASRAPTVSQPKGKS